MHKAANRPQVKKSDYLLIDTCMAMNHDGIEGKPAKAGSGLRLFELEGPVNKGENAPTMAKPCSMTPCKCQCLPGRHVTTELLALSNWIQAARGTLVRSVTIASF